MRIVPIRQRYRKSCGPACLEMMARALGCELNEKKIISTLGGLRSFGVCTVKLAGVAAAAGLDVKCYSLTKRGKNVIREAATPLLLRIAASRNSYALLSIDPEVLAGNPPSRRTHNIVLTSYGKSYCYYADPADGELHKISTRRLFSAWAGAAHRVSAHTVILTRGARG